MTDRPTAELEGRLAAAFGRHALPAAPVSVYRHLELVVETAPGRGRVRQRRRALALVAVLALLAVAWLAFIGIILLGSGPAAAPEADSSAPTAIASVEGLPVRTVGAVLALRAGLGLRDQPVAIGGYWTNRSRGHSCAPPAGQPGVLEIYCRDGDYGITERPEPVLRFAEPDRGQSAEGPHLTPFIEGARVESDIAFVVGAWLEMPPVPIVVVGHFDDPRASECRPEARELCLDRYVVDRVVSFELRDSWARTPPLAAASFGPDGPPLVPFGADLCPRITEFGFVGWTAPGAIGLPDEDGVVWAMVSRDDEAFTDWADDPTKSGHQIRLMGKRMCAARHTDDTPTSGLVPTTLYLEWDDGRIMQIGAHATSH